MDERTARWRRRKEARPAEILAAALDCFAERGFAATRMEDVAARAGVTKGTVYLYFQTKQEMFEALVRSELLPNVERLEAAAADASATVFLERLLDVWATHVFPSRVSVLPKLMIAEAGNFPDLARFYLNEVVHRALALLRSVIRKGVESGEFRPVDADHVAYCVIAPLVFSVLWRHSFEPHDDAPLDVAALCRAHLDALLNGLRPPTSEAPAAG
jgi:AcrR family transcriptional regulator